MTPCAIPFLDAAAAPASQVLGVGLLPRLPLFSPLRGTTPTSVSILQAPVGFAAVSFLQVG